MASTRHRVTDARYGLVGNYVTYPFGGSLLVQSFDRAGILRICDDTVGNFRNANDFLLVESKFDMPTFSGRFPVTGSPTKELFSCPADYQPSVPSPLSEFPAFTPVELSNLAWEALAATNINTPALNAQTFIAELKDLPSLIKGWGSNLLKNVARGHLTWRWALKPMIRDLTTMFNLAESINAQANRLATLSQRKVERRRKALRSSSVTPPPTTVQLKSVGANIQGLRRVTYTEKVWCTVTWKLRDDAVIPPLCSTELLNLARRLTLGITSHAALETLWEVMPWSWFADWFLGVGTVLQATNNTVPVTWHTICIMRTSEAIAEVTAKSSSVDLGWCHMSGPFRQSEIRKERRVASPILPLAPSSLPFLSGKHWSILGSLAVLKRR